MICARRAKQKICAYDFFMVNFLGGVFCYGNEISDPL